jgi:hypothetical protein
MRQTYVPPSWALGRWTGNRSDVCLVDGRHRPLVDVPPAACASPPTGQSSPSSIDDADPGSRVGIRNLFIKSRGVVSLPFRVGIVTDGDLLETMSSLHGAPYQNMPETSITFGSISAGARCAPMDVAVPPKSRHRHSAHSSSDTFGTVSTSFRLLTRVNTPRSDVDPSDQGYPNRGIEKEIRELR